MHPKRKFHIERLEKRNLLATFIVNTFEDTVAANLATGQDANGNISLRSAIMAANALTTADKIVLSPAQSGNPNTSYRLTIAGRNENQAATGDLDIKGPLTIEGNGALIDAMAVDRVFEILPSSNVTFRNLTIEGGEAGEGGAIYNVSRLTLSSVTVSGTAAAAAPFPVKGGAIYNARSGVINANASTINGVAQGGAGANGVLTSNGGNGGDALGGAIYNLGKVSISGAGGVQGSAIAGRGGDGTNGTPGRDSFGTNGPSDGMAGSNGGNGGTASGGAIYNGVSATFQYTGSDVGSLFGEAISGAGGNGGAGGKGGDAGIWHALGASGLFAPGAAAAGGNGGNAGDSYGGVIYNALGSVILSTSHVNPLSYFGIITRVISLGGGLGGDGGQGGAGASDGSANGPRVSSGNGADGGNGGRGGSAYGGAIFSTGGTVQLDRVSIPPSGSMGAFAGQSGYRGSGGAAGIPADALTNGVSGGHGLTGGAGRTEGGAFRVKGGTFVINASKIEGVEAIAGDGVPNSAFGGAFNISNGIVTIQNSTIAGNIAKGGNSFYNDARGGSAFGGAVWLTGGSLSILNSSIDQNQVNGRSGSPQSVDETIGIYVGDSAGAGIGMTGGTLIIDQSTISGGKAFGDKPVRSASHAPIRGANGGSAYGGGIYATGGVLTLTNSTISGNQVISTPGTDGVFAPKGNGGNASGGGIYSTNAAVSISNTTIYGNSADMTPPLPGNNPGAARGGGIYHAGTGKVTLNHLTIAANTVGSAIGTANASGGGIFNASGIVEIQNSIVAQNVAGTGLSSQRDVGGSVTSLGYNLIGVRNNTTNFLIAGDRVGTNARPLNVGIGLLADNGGPTRTCALLASSIARDAANPSDATTIDQRGIGRPLNGRSDIGAFEFIV